MDKTEVGRLMSRLQGDVNAMQEFLETSVLSVGDIVLLFGIIASMLWLNVQLGLLTLCVLPILYLVRIVWLPRARGAFMDAHIANSVTNGAFGRGNPRRAPRCRAWTAGRSISRSTPTRRTPP